MTGELQVFSYKDAVVRTVERDGEVWFVAKDVCDVLELTNPTVAIEALDEDERSKFFLGRQGEANIINESGLYALVFRSNKPEAKAFSKWVRSEVLPQIRRTGSYSLHKEQPALPSGVIEGARVIFEVAGIKDNQLSLALDKVYASYTGRSALKAGEVELVAPTQNHTLTPTQIGKRFGLNARQVNEKLAYAGYQHRVCGLWEPIGAGKEYGVMIDTHKRHMNGTPVRQLRWNSRILEVFSGMLMNE